MHIKLIQSVHNENEKKYSIQDIPIFSLDNQDIRNGVVSDKNSVIEDAWYSVQIVLDNNQTVSACDFYLNEELLECEYNVITSASERKTIIEFIFEKRNKAQIFLMQYDIVRLGIQLNGKLYSSYYMLCLSSNIDDYNSVKNMIQALLEFEDETICRWVFQKNDYKALKFSLLQGSLVKDSYKSIESYHQLINDIINCYKKNNAIFHNHASSKILYEEEKISYDKMQRLGQHEFNWLAQNLDVLREVRTDNAILYGSKRYLPQYMKCQSSKKSTDIYENRIIVNFLALVVRQVKHIIFQFEKEINCEREVYTQLQKIETKSRKAPILIIKEFQLKNADFSLNKLKLDLELLEQLYMNYQKILPCKKIENFAIPRKTKIFQEILHYKEIYNVIILWYKYGEMSLAKENLIFRIKTIDKIYEYFCLFKLLLLFKQHGYVKKEIPDAIDIFNYELPNKYIYSDLDVANTYKLEDGNSEVTIYYQPVIYSKMEETTNGIDLYRIDGSNNYYTPDFLVQYKYEGEFSYAIFDSKFSRRKNLKSYKVLQELMVKYCISLASKSGAYPAVNYMWLFQGRNDENSIYFFNSSPLSRKYNPTISYGIYTLNEIEDLMSEFWEEWERIFSK